MSISASGWGRALSLLFLSLIVPLAFAGGRSLTVDAGQDQTVAAGDLVTLSGSLAWRREHRGHDDDHDRDGHHERDRKDRHHKQRKHSDHGDGHRDRHGADDDHGRGHHKRHHDDDRVISWTQTEGTTVTLASGDGLSPSFVAPIPAQPGEALVFTLAVHDDDGELLGSDTVRITVTVPTSNIGGRITAVDGMEIPDVSIRVLSAGATLVSLTGGAQGEFAATLAADRELVLHLSAAGFADQVVPVRTPTANASQFFDITMIARGAAQSFDAGADATLSGADGSEVSVAAGSFVDQNGQPVVGPIDLTITPVDVSSPASLAAFPGEFSGVLEGDTGASPIVSLGTVEFQFSQNGNPLQLAAGQSAQVLIPVYFGTYQDGSPINLGDSIPLWNLDEDTGLWTQEGVGVVVAAAASPTGLAMQATVGHFSWWNCDVSMNAAQAIVTVFGTDSGSALVRARTAADIGWRPGTVDTVTPVGTPTPPLYIPSNGEVCFWADITFDDGSTGSTLEQCLTAAPNALVNVDLVQPIPGPLNIVTSPADTAGVLDVTAYLGFPVSRVQIKPTTYESSVSYAIVSGGLPAGLSLNVIDATRAEIAGVPADPGPFSVVVQGTDADGTTDTVIIHYDVTTDVPPPELPAWISAYDFNDPAMIDLNMYNEGGPVTHWTFSYNPLWEQGPPPPSIILDPSSGVVTITGSCEWWSGLVIASNASGSSEANIDISNCGF